MLQEDNLQYISLSGGIEVILDDKVRIATVFSGGEAPIAAAEELVGESNIRHVWGCDNAKGSEKFVLANFQPEHWYRELDEFVSSSSPRCSICDGPCTAKSDEDIDILIAGFNCHPFNSRHTDGKS